MTALLIVEDDTHFRGALARELESHGFAVHTAASAELAAEILAREAIDVLLTDLRLGGLDGIDLLRRLPALSRRTRTVLMSAYASARDHQIATGLGAVTVLVKPFTASELLATIQKAIDCETGFQGSIHGLSLIDMAQMFHLAQRSISLHIGPPGENPSILLFSRGEIVHAQHGHLQGTAALRAVLATPSGTIRTAALPDDAPQTIDTSFGHLILESLSQLDEELHESQRTLGPRTPSLGLPFIDDDAPPALDVGSSFATDTLLAEIEGFEDATPPPRATSSTTPTLPPPDPTTDTIYAAWRPTPRTAPAAAAPVPAAPPLQPPISQACKDLLAAIDSAVACAVVDLASGHLLGYHQSAALAALADRTIAAALHSLFAGPALGRLAALGGRGDATAALQEVQLTSPQHYFFARVLADGTAAVALLTRKTINLGMGWALLRSNLGKLEPLLRQG
jgi:CheY-like chemotaxis protein